VGGSDKVEQPDLTIELLINPFCLCDRDIGVLGGICKKHGVAFVTHNLWEIDDEDVYGLPKYLADLIRGWRSGEQPGSVHSDVFINGERFPGLSGFVRNGTMST